MINSYIIGNRYCFISINIFFDSILSKSGNKEQIENVKPMVEEYLESKYNENIVMIEGGGIAINNS